MDDYIKILIGLIVIILIILLLLLFTSNEYLTIDPKYHQKYLCGYDLLGYKTNLFNNNLNLFGCPNTSPQFFNKSAVQEQFTNSELSSKNLKAINWQDATTIGQKMYYEAKEKRTPSSVYMQELEYQNDEQCRDKQDRKLARLNPRTPLRNEGSAFVDGLITKESFETDYTSKRKLDELSNVIKNKSFKFKKYLNSPKHLYET